SATSTTSKMFLRAPPSISPHTRKGATHARQTAHVDASRNADASARSLLDADVRQRKEPALFHRARWAHNHGNRRKTSCTTRCCDLRQQTVPWHSAVLASRQEFRATSEAVRGCEFERLRSKQERIRAHGTRSEFVSRQEVRQAGRCPSQ